MPQDQKITAKKVLEINDSHPIAKKLKDLYSSKKDKDNEQLRNYAKVLFAQAKLIEGLELENPTEISNIICDLLS